ncbi:hypothetical protein M0811_04082 [Anaeramoeba ignava]|uniref:ARMC9 CTLH-like domain-containing protein n=1 Tax=Anaeramoeba ignava TaxID=1746090 RepID=A0A9Q0RIG8_ANAIG|nr:hypothetical protein M0811_04082 [Anaeramoeba ignava]
MQNSFTELPALHKSIKYCDHLVSEYLLFRGFKNAIQCLENDKNNTKTHEFKVKKLVDEMFCLISDYEAKALSRLWDYFDKIFFKHLDNKISVMTIKIINSLKKYYIVNCISHQKFDKVKEFFEIFADTMTKTPEMLPWFSILYIENPEKDPRFSAYFSLKWVETLKESTSNFFNSLFENIPRPRLLNFYSEYMEKQALENLIMTFEQKNEATRNQISFLEQEIHNLKEKAESLRISNQPIKTTENIIEKKSQEIKIIEQTKEIEISQEKEIPKSNDTFDIIERIEYIHSGSILSCRISENTQHFASGSSDGTVKIWKNKSKTRKFKVDSPVRSLEWSQNGNFLFCGTSNHKIQVWNREKNSILFSFDKLPFPKVSAMRIHPSQQIVFASTLSNTNKSGSLDSIILKDGTKKNFVIQAENTGINSFDLNHNGSLIVTGGYDGVIRVFDMNQKEIMEWKAHQKEITSVKITLDETGVLSVGVDGKMFLWSLINQKQYLQEFQLPNLDFDQLSKKPSIEIATENNFFLNLESEEIQIYNINKSQPTQILTYPYTISCMDLSLVNRFAIFGTDKGKTILNNFSINSKEK